MKSFSSLLLLLFTLVLVYFLEVVQPVFGQSSKTINSKTVEFGYAATYSFGITFKVNDKQYEIKPGQSVFISNLRNMVDLWIWECPTDNDCKWSKFQISPGEKYLLVDSGIGRGIKLKKVEKDPCASNPSESIVTFYANISRENLTDWTGHAWVGLCVGNQEVVYGFYPKGLLSDKERKADINYSFKVSKLKVQSALKIVNKYKSEKYILGILDCRRFVQYIAKELGLKVSPVGIKSPEEWMADLVDAN